MLANASKSHSALVSLGTLQLRKCLCEYSMNKGSCDCAENAAYIR
jgi:hypothetical protein